MMPNVNPFGCLMDMSDSWSREEVEAAVADYFVMLGKELRAEPYNKAEHNRQLQNLLSGRTQGSVERKHQNTSAVLIDLGYPREHVEERVHGSSETEHLAGEPAGMRR
jgi:hypothetical protein